MICGVVIYLLVLWESCGCSTGKYLSNMDTALSVLDYVNQLHENPPNVSMTMVCYHMETRTTTSTDSNGNVTTSTYQVQVVTYREREEVDIVSWQDVSMPLTSKDVEEYQLTKLKLTKTFTGDDNFTQQKNSLIARNRNRDVCYNLHVNLAIDGFKSHVLSFVDLEKKPPCATWGWFFIANLTFFPSLPYRIWISAITGKIQHEVHKAIQTTGSPP
jgi:TMEM151 family